MPDINGKTLLVGLLATPIRHSNSPRMQSEAFAMTGVNCVQLAFEVGNEQLEDAVKGLRALGAVGFNVSMPNKRMVTQYLDELSTAAALSGSVNTVVNDNGQAHRPQYGRLWLLGIAPQKQHRVRQQEGNSRRPRRRRRCDMRAGRARRPRRDSHLHAGRQVRKDCEGACRKDKREHLLQGRNVHDRG